MSDTAYANNNFAHYRSLIEDPASRTQSMEYEGVNEHHFAGAISDQRSSVLHTKDGAVPLCLALRHMPWYNEAYFRKLVGPNGELLYYNHLPTLLAADSSAYVEAVAPALGRLVSSGGLLLVDHIDTDKPMVDEGINDMARSLGLTAIDRLAEVTPPVQHYLYSRQISRASAEEPSLETVDYQEAFEAAMAEGRLVGKNAELRTVLSDDESEHIWQYYDRAFARLNDVDPILASFNEKELKAILADPRFLKFTYPSDGEIANVAVVSDIRNCPWMNQAYYRHNLPAAYDSGNVYYSPLVVSDRSSRSSNAGMSVSTIGLLMKGFAVTGIDPIMSFVCDEVSDKQVPKLAQLSINRTGILRADFSQPDDIHIFRAFDFERS